MTASTTRHFADRYGTSRKLFLDAAKGENASLETFQNPAANGPLDEPLYTDVARIGPPPGEAGQVLVVTSAVHGVEGFGGAGLQVFLLREELYRTMPESMALVIIHAVNPHGFAHARRVTEGNVDLNRNFLPHDGSYPDDSDYGYVHGLVVAADLGAAPTTYAERTRSHIEKFGLRAYQEAVTGGQWSHADGLFYGGRSPVWSNTMLRAICAAHTKGARAIAHLDLHTGLGPYGHGELICSNDPLLGADRVNDWFGTDTVTKLGDAHSASAPLKGVVAGIWRDHTTTAQVTTATLELGTRDLHTVLESLSLDNWLYLYGDITNSRGAEIKARIRDAFYPDETRWKEMVCVRAEEVIGQSIAGLAG